MTVSFVRDRDFSAFVAGLIQAGPVYAAVARRSKFVFERLEAPGDLRLDYDVTILPPKKLFFPPAQDLLRFDGPAFRAPIEPEEKVLLGVHFYDVKALDMTDLLMSERNFDVNYMAHRQTTTIVASNIQRVSPRAFFASVGPDVAPKGHDAFLTKIAAGYLYEALTPKGEALLQHGVFRPASSAEVLEAEKVNGDVLAQCPEQLPEPRAEMARKVRASFRKEAMWEEFATDCFSCGSCNTVCPTCYCFNVEDWWNVDQKSGARTRYWDACLIDDFAEVSLGAGAKENFRETRGWRFRHRLMRKAAYLNEKLGGPACVGCGRCSQACPADIADPVRVIGTIMASQEH